MYKLLKKMTAISFLLGAASLQAAPGERLGYNVSGVQNMNDSSPFINAFKSARGWITHCEFDWQRNRAADPGCTKKTAFNTKESHLVQVDANGWPMRLPARGERPIFTSISAIWELPKSYPTGTYSLTYKGRAKVQLRGDIKLIRQAPGRIDFVLRSPKKNLQLHIKEITQSDYIRDIKLISAKNARYAKNQRLSPDYMRRIREFNVIRFMLWQNVKDGKWVHWDERPTPDTAFYTGELGVPIESMVEMANIANAAPWFSMPHLATDDTIRQFAQLVAQRIRPTQNVYVEYSNEVWNAMYPATKHAMRMGQQLWPTGRRDVKNENLRKLLLAVNYNGKRTKEICTIWKQAFGARANRVRCIGASYASSTRLSEELLSCPLAGGDCARHLYAFAVAPYFGDYIARIENRPHLRKWAKQGPQGMTALFDEIMNGTHIDHKVKGGSIPRMVAERVRPVVNLARKYRTKLISYEGGQHLLRVDRPHVIHDPKIFTMLHDANKDPRMGQAYDKYHRAWRAAGGGLMMHFNGISESNIRNFFSFLDSSSEMHSPKYDALMRYLRGR